ncbi:xylose isomerase isoform X1 [Astyanax mexicanus]|uniref:Xylose isomerase isoform X1 n=1 Tax=Astyanax mexicanus TaxID=7994 RepID=A0A8T2MFC7_ASTMX|nr:xylose isomerase isoform X1 [Astyanax mexicanus]
MEEKWDTIYAFLAVGTYPNAYNKSQRQNLRRYASKFQVKDGDLFFEMKRKVIKKKGLCSRSFIPAQSVDTRVS